MSSPSSKGIQYVTEEEQRVITNSFSKNEAAESKQKQCSAMDVSGGESKVWCHKEQNCIRTWNVRSMNQGKFSLVQFSHSVMSNSLWPHELQHTRPPCPSPTPRVHLNPRPSSRWCHPAISSSVVPFSSYPHPSQHQSLFQWVNSSHEVARVLEFQL